MCAPIEGTDAARLADCLGLEGSKYGSSGPSKADYQDDAMTLAGSWLDDDRRYQVTTGAAID